MTDTKQKIRAVLEEHMGPTKADSFADDAALGVDDREDQSVLAMALSTELKVQIPPSMICPAVSINDIAAFADAMISKASNH